MSLSINNLSVTTQDSEILHDISFAVNAGEVHALIGPNGGGKSTLANTLAGHPAYSVKGGSIVLDEQDITDAKPNERAKAGLFLSMQYTPVIEGVSATQLLRVAKQTMSGSQINPLVFHKALTQKATLLGIDPSFLTRSINSGFSGGEKKKMELLQLIMLDPKYAILDETDSGLDVDALKLVAETIGELKKQGKGVLIITHYTELLDAINADAVHIMIGGRIKASGGKELVKQVREQGYAGF